MDSELIIELAIAAVLKPLVERARGYAAPVLAFIPTELMDKAEAGLLGFVENLLRDALAMLEGRGLLTITTSGQITLTPHKGPHPDDT